MPASSPSISPGANPTPERRRAAVADSVAPATSDAADTEVPVEPRVAPSIVPDAEPPAADAVAAEPEPAAMVQAPLRTAARGAVTSASAAVPTSSVTRVGFAPIVRVDAPRREVELCATSEAIDTYGTVFDYAASKDAFHRWIGNVREMHERRAVGTRVAVRFDDPARRIYVTVRVSLGAQDTWEKILDGTLRGASIGASNVTWERQVRRVAGCSLNLDPLNTFTQIFTR